ncbi:MAG: hypothetical protein KDJ70_19035 [Candidatus Competibacteraceae bacterium]|nr:hypothetical protein [Candidatus Competibacteraceae bacterium]
MSQEPEYRLPPLGALFRWGVVIAGALYVLVHYGLSGLFSFAILAGLVLLSAWLRSGDEVRPRKHLPNAFNEQKFGPTLNEQLCDPAYNAYAENSFHKHYHGKN